MAINHNEWDLDCKVYVGGLGEGADKQSLEVTCGRYGIIKNIWVARNPPGFAFVEYTDPRDAEDAVKGLNDRIFDGRRLRVEKSTGKTRKELKPWYKDGPDGKWRYRRRSDSRSWTRSRSRSRSRSPRSYRGRKRRSRSGSLTYRRSYYRSRSYESSMSLGRESSHRSPLGRIRRYRYSSESSYNSSRSRYSRRSRSRKRSYDHTRREHTRSRSRTERKYGKSDVHYENNTSPKPDCDKTVPPRVFVGTDYVELDQHPDDGISGEVIDGVNRTLGVQTNHFLMLYYLEKEPDVLSETFLRVDRDKVLNSSHLPEIIPTIYQRRVIVKTDSEEAVSVCITGPKSCIVKPGVGAVSERPINKVSAPRNATELAPSQRDNEESLDYDETMTEVTNSDLNHNKPVSVCGHVPVRAVCLVSENDVVRDKRNIVVNGVAGNEEEVDKSQNPGGNDTKSTSVNAREEKVLSEVNGSKSKTSSETEQAALAQQKTIALNEKGDDHFAAHTKSKRNNSICDVNVKKRNDGVVAIADEHERQKVVQAMPVQNHSQLVNWSVTGTRRGQHSEPDSTILVCDKNGSTISTQRGRHKVQNWLQRYGLYESDKALDGKTERHHKKNGATQCKRYWPAKDNNNSSKRDKDSERAKKRAQDKRDRNTPIRKSQSKFDRLRDTRSRSSSEEESTSDSITSEKILRANEHPGLD